MRLNLYLAAASRDPVRLLPGSSAEATLTQGATVSRLLWDTVNPLRMYRNTVKSHFRNTIGKEAYVIEYG